MQCTVLINATNICNDEWLILIGFNSKFNSSQKLPRIQCIYSELSTRPWNLHLKYEFIDENVQLYDDHVKKKFYAIMNLAVFRFSNHSPEAKCNRLSVERSKFNATHPRCCCVFSLACHNIHGKYYECDFHRQIIIKMQYSINCLWGASANTYLREKSNLCWQ